MTTLTENKLPPIMLIEDDEIDTEVVKSFLNKYRFQNPFHHAKDGVDALEILTSASFKNQSKRPCTILLDINMPRMNGLQLLSKIRAIPSLKESIVYILTTSTLNRDIASAYTHNVAGYILKDQTEELFALLARFFAINQFCESA